MDGRDIEPRKTVWAVAEVYWQEADGTSFRAPATLEDTSSCGACVRVKRPFSVGSRVTIKWHREQFSAVARNCRRDGRDFLLGVRREPSFGHQDLKSRASDSHASSVTLEQGEPPSAVRPDTVRAKWTAPPRVEARSGSAPVPVPSVAVRRIERVDLRSPSPMEVSKSPPARQFSVTRSVTASSSERNVMQNKSLIPQFWRRQSDPEAQAKTTAPEAPVNKLTIHGSDAPSGVRNELLSYEDIYRAAGILSPGSGYGIHKVVDMLNNDRIRDLSKDVKRASVLMALDAAGISVDELLTDATRRQNALNSYESSQRKQLETFEVRKAQENTRIEEEMEKIRAHYAERVQNNLDQVAAEKEALRNWQSAMQHESQRISEVIELCGKQPAVRGNALGAAAGASNPGEKPTMAAEASQVLRPNSLSKD